MVSDISPEARSLDSGEESPDRETSDEDDERIASDFVENELREAARDFLRSSLSLLRAMKDARDGEVRDPVLRQIAVKDSSGGSREKFSLLDVGIPRRVEDEDRRGISQGSRHEIDSMPRTRRASS